MTPELRSALQRLLDGEGDGWHLRDFVVVMGLEKLDPPGMIESTSWIFAPPDQPDYITDGLIAAAQELREGDDDDD